jgi:DNA repair protein RecO (recombination protein O)
MRRSDVRGSTVPTIADMAICIRRWDFSETSQTVSLFTRVHGVIRGLAKGSKRAKGRAAGGIDLLTRGHLMAIVKPAHDLALVTEWSVDEVFPHLRTQLRANRAGFLMADLVHHMLTDRDPHPRLYDALAEALDALKVERDHDRALLRFEWSLLVECGYRPELDRDAVTGAPLPRTATLAFSPRSGGVAADTGAGDRWRVRIETVQLLREVAGGGSAEGADEGTVRRAAWLLASYLRELIGRELPTMPAVFPER